MNLQELSNKIKGIKTIVLGDMMLDGYKWGKVQRISPEAPVPVIEISKEEYRLGGAANVALNLASLGADVFAVGIMGTGVNSRIMKKLFKQHGLNSSGLIAEKGRKTTIKTRIGAATQQIVRIDIEDTTEPDELSKTQIMNILKEHICDAKLMIIEDYNKGLLCADIIRQSLDLCKKYQVPVAVDPKQKNFFLYRKVDIFKPNFIELQTNLGQRFETDADFTNGAMQILKKLECKHLVVTRGAKGMCIFSADNTTRYIPSCAQEVFDVSGAGDTVISALGLAYAAGEEILSAAEFANIAAGVVCGKMGTASATIEEIVEYAKA
ncbi:MAG: D-glycero-beta-D-manno-heptose-7-phosphate kinase [Candidatus Cloacimonetes bacterium]|nr:D-glycero-beta-D-manno-heptose-7-phosphate kinase [Candidatus Cloacimonadota bacterium]